jgi:hypothetical protein
MTEESRIVVAECTVRGPKKEGDFMTLRAWNAFELDGGKVRGVDSVTVMMQNPA